MIECVYFLDILGDAGAPKNAGGAPKNAGGAGGAGGAKRAGGGVGGAEKTVPKT